MMAKLSGDWRSYYRYPSTGRGEDFWGEHTLQATQTGTSLTLVTGSDSPSQVVMELEIDDKAKIASGVWRERTDPNGYYKGAEYDGTVELRLAATGDRMSGVWHGTGRSGTMNSDIWELSKVKTTTRTTNLPKRWKLTHWYPSSDDKREESDEHEMKSYWQDETLVLESLPKANGSYILARLHIQDGVATGGWYESASLRGEHDGAQYSGTGQLIIDPKTNHMKGIWAGAGYNHELKQMQIYTGRWEIVPISEA